MPALQFRELLKSVFGVILTPEELGAVVKYFDETESYEVSCKPFLVHMTKSGYAGRTREHSKQLNKQRQEIAQREREERQKLATQWASKDQEVDWNYSEAEKASAIEKIKHVAIMYDPVNPGPIGLKAFKGPDMGPGIFR